jgi:hypothetical protein
MAWLAVSPLSLTGQLLDGILDQGWCCLGLCHVSYLNALFSSSRTRSRNAVISRSSACA